MSCCAPRSQVCTPKQSVYVLLCTPKQNLNPKAGYEPKSRVCTTCCAPQYRVCTPKQGLHVLLCSPKQGMNPNIRICTPKWGLCALLCTPKQGLHPKAGFAPQNRVYTTCCEPQIGVCTPKQGLHILLCTPISGLYPKAGLARPAVHPKAGFAPQNTVCPLTEHRETAFASSRRVFAPRRGPTHRHLPPGAPGHADGDPLHGDQQPADEGSPLAILLLHLHCEGHQRVIGSSGLDRCQRVVAVAGETQRAPVESAVGNGAQHLAAAALAGVAAPHAVAHLTRLARRAARRLARHRPGCFALATLAAMRAGEKLLARLVVATLVQAAALGQGDAAVAAQQEAVVAEAAFGAGRGFLAFLRFRLASARGRAGWAAELVVLVRGADGAWGGGEKYQGWGLQSRKTFVLGSPKPPARTGRPPLV